MKITYLGRLVEQRKLLEDTKSAGSCGEEVEKLPVVICQRLFSGSFASSTTYMTTSVTKYTLDASLATSVI